MLEEYINQKNRREQNKHQIIGYNRKEQNRTK